MNNKRSGFTLIELLVVIFIISLLASVVLVGLGTFRARGRDAKRIADLRSVQNILELYYAKNGDYPSATDWASLETEVVGAGIGVSRLPKDPGNENYQYGASSNNQSYVLGAKLEEANNLVLRDSIKGSGPETYGVNCNDPVYCIKF